MTSQAFNRPVDVDSFFADLLCYLSSRDDLAGYETEQTEQVRAAVADLIEAAQEADKVLQHLGCDADNSPRVELRAALAAIGSQP